MKRFGPLILLVAVFVVRFGAAEEYSLGPDSQRQPGIPQGKITHYTWTSKIFPGTVRDYWVYVPAQYVSDKPACLMVFQDGEGFMKEDGRARVPIVFDNLIAKHEMPVTIGVFINPGVLKAISPDQQDRFNRSFEYDALGDRYARFLTQEILPEVAKHYNLSTNPDDHAISGLSSGGICAFTVAWNRPDAFHRVLSFIGSFTDLRGGDIYPSLIRKTEPKPVRVFLQDGSNDLNIYAGSWWLANQSIASALDWAGYDVKFVTGDKNHDMLQGGAILPDALRWLWRDYPKPITKPAPNHNGDKRTAILDPGNDWKVVAEDVAPNSGLAVDSEGSVYFTGGEQLDIMASGGKEHIEMIRGDAIGDFRGGDGYATGLAFGADGRLYACEGKSSRIVVYAPNQPKKILSDGVDCLDLSVAHNNGIYVTDPRKDEVWYFSPTGEKRVAYIWRLRIRGEVGYVNPNLGRIHLSPDQSLAYISDPKGRWVRSLQIRADEVLDNNVEPFYRLEAGDESSATGALGMTVDSLGYLYVTTNLGIQVCDQPGRVVAIINPPSQFPSTQIVFGGPDLQDLYVVAGHSLYCRHLLRKGVLPWVPQKPPAPQL